MSSCLKYFFDFETIFLGFFYFAVFICARCFYFNDLMPAFRHVHCYYRLNVFSVRDYLDFKMIEQKTTASEYYCNKK